MLLAKYDILRKIYVSCIQRSMLSFSCLLYFYSFTFWDGTR